MKKKIIYAVLYMMAALLQTSCGGDDVLEPQLVQGIVLSETSIALSLNEQKTLTAIVLPSDAMNKKLTWSSSKTDVATVNQSGKVIANANGTCTITCSATDGSGVKATCKVTVGGSDGTIGGHAYVQIGGLKWATMNVGATTVAGKYATCLGDYFAWGETEPRYMTITFPAFNDPAFTWRGDYGSNGGYHMLNGPTYMGATLDASHDAATANWGGSWRTPKREEFVALIRACTGSDSDSQTPVKLIKTITEGGIYWLSSTQTIEPLYTGVAGLLFVSKADISKRVFFPTSGVILGLMLMYYTHDGNYWSSSLSTSYADYAYSLSFRMSSVKPSYDGNNCYGQTVRPVSD